MDKLSTLKNRKNPKNKFCQKFSYFSTGSLLTYLSVETKNTAATATVKNDPRAAITSAYGVDCQLELAGGYTKFFALIVAASCPIWVHMSTPENNIKPN